MHRMFRHTAFPPDEADMRRTAATSTGSMLVAPFLAENNAVPEPPPLPFIDKTDFNYKKTNRFSNHDNRHSFQDHGVYFGDGHDSRFLGRKLLAVDRRLHHTDADFLQHETILPVPVHKNSLYTSSFLGEPTKNPPVHRRFAKTYHEPEKGYRPLDTTTTDWFKSPDVPHRTPLQLLAVSQEPFLDHNPWKYSRNSLRKVYPPYECKQMTDIPLNRYGAAFQNNPCNSQ